MIEQNIIPKVQVFKHCHMQWHHRKLTLLGKVTVIKSFALPKILYPFTVLQNPSEDTVNDIQLAIYKFLWDNKTEKFKRETLKRKHLDGGLNLTDIN